MRILVVTSASGGHIFPALSFIEALKKRQPAAQVQLVLPQRSQKLGICFPQVNVKYIAISALRFKPDYQGILAIGRFLKGTAQSVFVLTEYHPDVVIGFGGIESVPMMLFAWFFRVKTFIHEQNVLPGKANKLLSKFVDKVAVSFKETKDALRIAGESIVVTGNPMRMDLGRIEKAKAQEYFGFDKNKITILVMGGSQGSHSLNSAFMNMLRLSRERGRLQIIHLAGAKDLVLIESGYRELGVQAKVFAFLKEMHYAYSASDIVVSRAGATSITEILFFKIPAILIPYPFAKQHQAANAGVLEIKGCAVVVQDQELEIGGLQKAIEWLLRDATKMALMRNSFPESPADSADILAQEVLKGSI